MSAAKTLRLHQSESRVMDRDIDLTLKEYLDEKFSGIQQQISANNATTTSRQSRTDAQIEGLVNRIGKLEAEIQTLAATRVTVVQLLVAVATTITVTTGVVIAIVTIIG